MILNDINISAIDKLRQVRSTFNLSSTSEQMSVTHTLINVVVYENA